MQTFSISHVYLIMNCWSGRLQGPNPICQCSWLFTRTKWQHPAAEDTAHFDCRTWKNQAGSELQTYSLMASFHIARRCYAGCCGGVGVKSSICLGKMWRFLQHWHGCYGNNQLVTDLIQGLICRRKFTHDIVKLWSKTNSWGGLGPWEALLLFC